MKTTDELSFQGSILQTEINNKPTEKQMQYIIMAANSKPESQFWKEALEAINVKIKVK